MMAKIPNPEVFLDRERTIRYTGQNLGEYAIEEGMTKTLYVYNPSTTHILKLKTHDGRIIVQANGDPRVTITDAAAEIGPLGVGEIVFTFKKLPALNELDHALSPAEEDLYFSEIDTVIGIPLYYVPAARDFRIR